MPAFKPEQTKKSTQVSKIDGLWLLREATDIYIGCSRRIVTEIQRVYPCGRVVYKGQEGNEPDWDSEISRRLEEA